MMDINRRRFLGFLGGASIVGLVGCGDKPNTIDNGSIQPNVCCSGDVPEMNIQPGSGNLSDLYKQNSLLHDLYSSTEQVDDLIIKLNPNTFGV